jgi:hypothetical protein
VGLWDDRCCSTLPKTAEALHLGPLRHKTHMHVHVDNVCTHPYNSHSSCQNSWVLWPCQVLYSLGQKVWYHCQGTLQMHDLLGITLRPFCLVTSTSSGAINGRCNVLHRAGSHNYEQTSRSFYAHKPQVMHCVAVVVHSQHSVGICSSYCRRSSL